MSDIIYNGGFEELQALKCDCLDIDIDKLLEWLVTSSNVEYDSKVSSKLNKIVRKRKILKINDGI